MGFRSQCSPKGKQALRDQRESCGSVTAFLGKASHKWGRSYAHSVSNHFPKYFIKQKTVGCQPFSSFNVHTKNTEQQQNGRKIHLGIFNT